MPLTPEQVKGIVSDMVDAGFNESEIDDTLRGQGVNRTPQLTMDKPLAQQGLSFAQSMAPVAGAVAGGLAAPALAEKYLPQAISKYIPRAVLSGLGQGAGAAAGGMAVGVPPKEAIKQGAVVGAVGGGVEGALNLGSRLIGATTSVPGETISRTLAKPTVAGAKTMIGKPGLMEERGIGAGLLRRLAEMRANISPGRLTKVAIRDAAHEAGVVIPLDDLHATIDSGAREASTAVGQANTIATAKLDSLKQRLIKKFPAGTMTPKQADAQLQAFQRDAEMAAARGNPFLATTYRSLKDSLRNSFFKSVDEALPGSDIAKATGEAKRYLDSIDSLEQFVSDKTPETFVRGLFNREQPAQSALQALRDFEAQAGTAGSLERQIHDLAMKRDWTTTEGGRAFSLWRAVEKIVAKPLTKVGIVAARPAGQTAAALTAFQQAMQPRNNP